MARNRIIYQSEALFAGQLTGVTDAHNENQIKQLHRVQSANYAFNISRTDVNQFGELAAIDRVVLDTPTVSLDFSYYLANFANEANLGFTVNGVSSSADNMTSALSGILNRTADERNFFIQTSREGEDAVGDENRHSKSDSSISASTIGIGNAFMTSYSSEASVGGFPTVSIAAEGMNMNFSTGTTGVPNPGIDRINGTAATTLCDLPPASGSATLESSDDPTSGILGLSTLRPGDITIKVAENDGTNVFGTTNYDLGGAKLPTSAGDATSSANIQSYNISFDLGRTPIQRLGNRFAFAREIDFPVNLSLSVDAILTDLTTGNLNDLIDCEKSYNVEIELKGATGDVCGAAGKTTVAKYVLKDMRPDSQSFSSSIGDNKTVTIDFTSQIGGPRQNDVGLFMAGVTQANTVDQTGPTFETFEVQSANQHVNGTVSGDLVFKFNEPVQHKRADGTTRDLLTSDFVLKTGATVAMTDPDTLTSGTHYQLINNVSDKTFVLRFVAPGGIAKMNTDAASDLFISGNVQATTNDLLGNAIAAAEAPIHTAIDSQIFGTQA